MKVDLNERTIAARISEIFQGFEQVWEVISDEMRFSIAGRSYLCRTDFSEYGGIISNAAARPGSQARASHDPPCRILVVDSYQAGRPSIEWHDPFFNERIIEALLAETPYRVHYHKPSGFWQAFDRQRRIGLQMMPGMTGRPKWDSGSPLRNFLHWDFASENLGLIHAGTLAIDGLGVLLAGEGGSGKSGTVLAGIGQGLRTVGDDYVLVDMHDKPHAFPLFGLAKQDLAGLRRAGILDHPELPETENWQRKKQFRLDAVFPGSVVGSMKLGAVLLPQISGATTTRFTPAGAKEAFLALAPSGVSQIPGDRNRSFALAARVSRELPCWHMELSTERNEISAAIRMFILERCA